MSGKSRRPRARPTAAPETSIKPVARPDQGPDQSLRPVARPDHSYLDQIAESDAEEPTMLLRSPNATVGGQAAEASDPAQTMLLRSPNFSTDAEHREKRLAEIRQEAHNWAVYHQSLRDMTQAQE